MSHGELRLNRVKSAACSNLTTPFKVIFASLRTLHPYHRPRCDIGVKVPSEVNTNEVVGLHYLHLPPGRTLATAKPTVWRTMDDKCFVDKCMLCLFYL